MIDPSVSKSIVTGIIELNKRPRVACGYEVLDVTGDTAQGFQNIPTEATYAEVRVESLVSGVAMRRLNNGNNPSVNDGIPVIALDLFDLDGGGNLSRFRIISVDEFETHTLQVQYFKP